MTNTMLDYVAPVTVLLVSVVIVVLTLRSNG